jgi:parvulin-like peptidyl-prolyl isomerase
MRFSTKTLALIGSLAVLAASCASGVVATVDDASIHHDDVVALSTDFQDRADLDGEAYRADLSNLIYLEAQKSAAERDFGLTGLDDPNAIAAKVASPTEEEAAVFESIRSNPERTEATVEAVAEQFIIRDAVGEAIVAPDLADIYENTPELIVAVCGRHILTETEEAALAAKERVEAGEAFADVADEVSIDTYSAGGELPCPQNLGSYVPEFAQAAMDATIGEMTDPVQSQYGWHVIVIEERTGPASLEELAADTLAYLNGDYVAERWGAWVNDAILSADVSVNSRVGSWAPAAFGILPPPAG